MRIDANSLAATVLAISMPGHAGDGHWLWERYEAGMRSTVTMKGSASLIRESPALLVFLLHEDDPAISAFELRLRIGEGRRVTATFTPPNTERVVLTLNGAMHRDRANGLRYFVLANADNGNFVVIRTRP